MKPIQYLCFWRFHGVTIGIPVKVLWFRALLKTQNYIKQKHLPGGVPLKNVFLKKFQNSEDKVSCS